MEKLHYYSFTFLITKGHIISYASVYIGDSRKFVSHPQIQDAKKHANVDDDAVLLSCCYLGEMTSDEFATGLTPLS